MLTWENIHPITHNSLIWRIIHSLTHLIEGVFFVVGSTMYFAAYNGPKSSFNGDLIGAWLFTIGSLALLTADLLEWDHFRTGSLTDIDPSDNLSIFTMLKRSSIGINYFFNVIGSFLYLIGSIFLIPATNLLIPGDWLYIVGSLFIFFSNLWKCIRTLSNNAVENDILGFIGDISLGIGALSYAIGSYLFYLADLASEINLATDFFIGGGVGFLISGILSTIRYFAFDLKHYKHKIEEDEEKLIE